MARVTVRPFERGDLDAAAALVAEAHQRDRERHPVLVEGLADEAEARSMLAKWLENERTDGAVAVDGDVLAGFLMGERVAGASPDSYMGRLAHPRTVRVGPRDNAVAAGYDARAVCRLLYRELAGAWVAAGYYNHSVHLIEGEERLQ
ncbi:MAG: hypothetical protein F4052_04045, partial [Dehalococcoidia bacterium]|nr:hypothetical protein [Dehalococcoidia bacterium]